MLPYLKKNPLLPAKAPPPPPLASFPEEINFSLPGDIIVCQIVINKSTKPPEPSNNLFNHYKIFTAL